MAFSNHPFFLFLLLLSLSSITHGADLIAKECGSNATTNVALQANINSVILDLVTNTSATGFAFSTYGSGNDTVYGTAECRGDITGQECTACIIVAGQEARTTCANANETRIYYHQCYLHYSNSNYTGQADTTLLGRWRSTDATKDPAAFRRSLNELFSVLTMAAAGGEGRKFAWGVIESQNKLRIDDGSVTKIYGMAHCTFDLGESTCLSCLGVAFSIYVQEDRDGTYSILKSCEIRFEKFQFLFLNAAPTPNINTRNITFSNI